MNIKNCGTIFIHTVGEYLESNSMLFLSKFKEKLEPEKVFKSLKNMILDHPSLQKTFLWDKKNKTFSWKQFNNEEINEFLEIEEEFILAPRKLNEIYRDFFPSHSRLPFGISLVDEFTLVFSIMHFIGNHHVINSWIEKWFYYYAKEIDIEFIEQPHIFKNISPLKKAFSLPIIILKTIGYLVSARSTVEKKGGESIHLTNGKKILPLKEGEFKTYNFTSKETKLLIETAKTKGLLFEGIIYYAFIHAFFSKFPNKNRICINSPQDIKKFIHKTTPFSTGNISGTLPFYFYRDEPIDKQIRSLFSHIKNGIPYGLMRLISAISFKQNDLRNKVLKDLSVPFRHRESLQDFTCTYSFNDVESEIMEQLASDVIFIGARSPLPLILCTKYNGCLTIVFAISNDLVNPEEAFSISETAIKYLREII